MSVKGYVVVGCPLASYRICAVGGSGQDAERARKAMQGRHDVPLAGQAMGNLAAYEAIRGRLGSGLELADEAAELAGAAGLGVHGVERCSDCGAHRGCPHGR